MQTIKVENIDGASVITCKPPLQKPPPGECREYRLVPVEEAAKIDKMQQLLEQANQALRSCYSVAEREGDETFWDGLRMMLKTVLDDQHKFMYPQQYADSGELSVADTETIKDGVIEAQRQELAECRARIAELEAKLNERSPGVMPEVVGELCDHLHLNSNDAHVISILQRVWKYYAPPFVFTGEPGKYIIEYGYNAQEEVDVDLTKGGRLIVFRKNGKLCSMMNSDGTFPGGRIVGKERK